MQANTFKKACAAAYPSTVQHDIVWFWPNNDPQYKDILVERKPRKIPQLDDPFYTDSGSKLLRCGPTSCFSLSNVSYNSCLFIG